MLPIPPDDPALKPLSDPGEPARGEEGSGRRHRQQGLDRLRLRPRVPRLRRRSVDHLPQRQDQTVHGAVGAGARRRGVALPSLRCARGGSIGGGVRGDPPEWGRLDILLHSIAFAPRDDLHGRVTDCSLQGFLLTMDISVHSLIRMTRLAEPLMMDGGAIFTMSYFGGEKVVPHYGIMGPAKAALEAAASYMAAELGDKGIRVNIISPGPVMTRAASGIDQFDELLEADQEARADRQAGDGGRGRCGDGRARVRLRQDHHR